MTRDKGVLILYVFSNDVGQVFVLTLTWLLLQLILLRQRAQQDRPGISFWGMFTIGESSVLTVSN